VELRLQVDRWRAGGDKLPGEPREQFFQGFTAAGEQAVNLPALRYSGPLDRAVGELVPVNQGDSVKALGQCRGGDQASYRGADDNSVPVLFLRDCPQKILPRARVI
jgi:hypothetical protein